MFTTKRTVRKHAKTSFPLGARLSRMGYVNEAVCFRAAANPGRDRSHVSSVAVRQMRKNPGVSNMAPGITRMSSLGQQPREGLVVRDGGAREEIKRPLRPVKLVPHLGQRVDHQVAPPLQPRHVERLLLQFRQGVLHDRVGEGPADGDLQVVHRLRAAPVGPAVRAAAPDSRCAAPATGASCRSCRPPGCRDRTRPGCGTAHRSKTIRL